ncbi:MAG: PhzF family phenazine biosynthesis protein [Betaproteobacteria bacterium]|nr:PhzF family phenazine biosynthesis protein [Betaproteobacteria bacterium]
MRLQYRLVNVFTRHGEPLSGNPLCVFEDGNGLDAAQMQALARQFNLSETTFVLPCAQADARVRIFTPTYEMPFAGHPTLGTAHVVRSLVNCGDRVTLELPIGPIPLVAQGDQWELRANAGTTRAPRASHAEIAAALGLDQSDLAGAALWVDSGSEQLIVPLADEATVRRVRISIDALRHVTQDGPRAQVYVFSGSGGDTLCSRFFFSQGESVVEDPATGSATANLGGWFLANGVRLPTTRFISQGEMAGRPSRLRLRIDARRDVFVAGEVIELGRGYVEWSPP